jgi:glycosyltransferase involved in cell wall biosynthesis
MVLHAVRVLSVLYDERVGGPQLRVLQVARRLKSSGFDTAVVMPKGEGQFAALLDQARISFHEMDLVRLRRSFNPIEHVRYVAKFWPNVMELRRLIRERHIDIVHTNGLMNLQTPVAARLEGVGLVWHLNDLGTPKLLRLMFLPLVRAWSDRIALAARAVGQYCFPEITTSDECFQLLYAPVDTERFSPQVDGTKVREELNIAQECRVVGIVANICPGKGQEYFLEAAAVIKRRYPNAKFLVVGGKLDNRRKFWSALMQQTARLGLGRDVFFTGRRSDVPQLLRAMTVFLQASESEACPMAVLEASASGLPVVATKVGGTPELVQDGVTGILIEPRNPTQIADAVLRLLDSPEMATRMGRAGADFMRQYFSLDACVEAHARMYNAILSRAEHVPSAARETKVIATENVEDVYSRN